MVFRAARKKIKKFIKKKTTPSITQGKATTRRLTSKEKTTFKESKGKRIRDTSKLRERKATIKLEPKKGIVRKAVDAQKKILTSTKTTTALAGTLGGGGVALARGVGGAVSKGAAKIGFSKGVPRTAETARKRGLTVVDTLGQVGKSGKPLDLSKTFIDVKTIGKGLKSSPAQIRAQSKAIAARRVNQIADRSVGSRFASNGKSRSLTRGWLIGIGVSLFVADKLIDIYGTYPWAAHNQREATDTLLFPMKQALDAGDLEGYDILAAEFDEITKAADEVISKLPYKNVIDSSKLGIANAIKGKAEFDRLAAKQRGELEFEGTSTGEDIAERDIERDKIQTERDEERTARDEEFKAGEEKRKVEEAEDLEFNREFFALIREKKFEEAEKLSIEREKKLKGGN